MQFLSLREIGFSMTIFALAATLVFVSCSQPSNGAAATTSSIAESSVPAPIALPNFTALVKKEGPAVINISTVRKVRGMMPFPDFPGLSPDDPFYDFFRHFAPGDQFPREFSSQSLGSGFIVSPDGYILTNAHVVEDADEVTVRLTDQREFEAKVIGTDRRSDIAVLKIDAHDLPVVSIGDSSKLEVGEWVVAIGSPFGFTNSVSQGIVSAKGRSLPGENIVPFIQTDVSVNPGNSGGPLFNLNGEVVGVNSQIYTRTGGYMGLSFAIPIDLAMKVKEELLKHGTVRRGWLGVTIQTVTPEHAEAFRLDKARGALVSSVEKDSPADRAGLAIGDIILEFNKQKLANADDLVRRVADTSPGSSVRLQVWRNGSADEITATLGELESKSITKKTEAREDDPENFGLRLNELNREERRRLHTEGYLQVVSVSGIAADSGIHPGDIIIAVNSQRISSIRQFRSVLAKTAKHAAVLVQRNGNMIFVPLKIKDR